MSRWVSQKKGWLKKDYFIKKHENIDFVNQQPEKEKVDNYAVMFYPIKCPRCNSKNVKRYKSNLPIRYHKCKDCGLNFKSVEHK